MANGDLGDRYSAYHHSHPTLTERLRAMELYASTDKGRPKVSTKEHLKDKHQLNNLQTS